MSDQSKANTETGDASRTSTPASQSVEAQPIEPSHANLTSAPPISDKPESDSAITSSNNTDQSGTIAEQDFVDRINKSDRWMIRLTAALVIFTFALVFVGGVQAWSFIESERAFLVPIEIKFGDNGFAANKRLQVIVNVQNAGRSPAFITTANVTPLITDNLSQLPSYNPTGTQSGGAMAANGGRALTFYEYDNPQNPGYLIDQSNFDMVNSGQATFYVFGYIEYTDEFALLGKRRIGFCSVYDPKNQSGAGPFSDCKDVPKYVYVK